MRQQFKRQLYRWYLLFAIAALGYVAFRAMHAVRPPGAPFADVTAVAAIASAVFAIQKQKLDELKLFHDLFQAFNARYDLLNDPLQDILLTGGELELAQKQHLVDYFNLCAEEYFFFRQGSIPPEVWRTWCRGMLYYLADKRVAALYVSEEKSASYYGLTKEMLERAAEE